MRINPLPVYVKSERSKHPRKFNTEEKQHMDKVRKLGCIVKNHECEGRTTIHHTGTGAGGRKNHMKVIGLCVEHHLGMRGINSLTGAMSRREWESVYGSESELLKLVDEKLGESKNG